VAEVRVGRPFDELELSDQDGAQPSAVFHLLCRDALSPSARAFLVPRNGHSSVTKGVIFLMSAFRLAVVSPFLVFAANRRPVSS
jgi:hypothetical protein